MILPLGGCCGADLGEQKGADDDPWVVIPPHGHIDVPLGHPSKTSFQTSRPPLCHSSSLAFPDPRSCLCSQISGRRSPGCWRSRRTSPSRSRSCRGRTRTCRIRYLLGLPCLKLSRTHQGRVLLHHPPSSLCGLLLIFIAPSSGQVFGARPRLCSHLMSLRGWLGTAGPPT